MSPQAQHLLELALPTLRDYALVLTDPRGEIVAWLCGAEAMFGYTADEIVGKSLAVLFVQEDLEMGLSIHELEVARRDSLSQDDRWHVRKDGTRIWVSGTVTALKSGNGLQGFIKVMRDRTDQRIEVESRTNQLEAMEGAMDRTRRFLQTLGHELRNPLAPLKNISHILSKSSDPVLVARAAETISNQVSVLERITADLMDVSRMQHKKLTLLLTEFDVRRLVNDEVADHKLPAAAKGLKLQAVLPPQPILLVADPDRLRQALGNLLGNAIKYTPEQGSIWVKVTQEADEVAIRVEDTGIGIPPDVLPKIFELFTQEQRAKDLVPGGLGVGLAIVNEVAELHGGVALARSSGVGRGSEFTLRFPRQGPIPTGE